MISLLLSRDDRGGRVEVGVVGREGMAGLSAVLGVATEFTQSLVQVPGEALRLPVEKFRAVADRDSKLLKVLLRYMHVFLSQLSQRAACNALHTIEKRLCFWLLTVHDQAGADRFPLTHEFLAAMLGVRRASVTEAARRLRQARLIHYGGGQLMVLNRHGLEKAACGCYRIVKTELRRVLG
jgi:CRP-like cAMP-binding protein